MEKEIIKYFIQYLLNDSNDFNTFKNMDFFKKLNELIGSRWIDWYFSFVKENDLDEWDLIQKDYLNKEKIGGYFEGRDKSPAYKWLVKCWRNIQLEELLRNEKYDRNYESI